MNKSIMLLYHKLSLSIEQMTGDRVRSWQAMLFLVVQNMLNKNTKKGN